MSSEEAASSRCRKSFHQRPAINGQTRQFVTRRALRIIVLRVQDFAFDILAKIFVHPVSFSKRITGAGATVSAYTQRPRC